MGTNKATLCGLPSFHWTLRGTGTLLLAVASCVHPTPRGVQMNLDESLLVLVSPVLVDDPEFYLALEEITCLIPVEDTGAHSWNILGHTNSVSRRWMGLGWKIPRNAHPAERYWRDLAERYQVNTHPMERYGGRCSVKRYWGISRPYLKAIKVSQF